MNYEDDIRIDDTALDVEWLEQASLALRYGRHWAIRKRAFIRAEEKVKVVRAELIAEANADPVKCCKKDKPNVADIEAYYRNHKRHKEAKEEWVTAQFELDMAEVAKNEFSFTRKAALENLVRLHGQQYFAGPSVPRDLAEQRASRERAVSGEIGKGLSRKK